MFLLSGNRFVEKTELLIYLLLLTVNKVKVKYKSTSLVWLSFGQAVSYVWFVRSQMRMSETDSTDLCFGLVGLLFTTTGRHEVTF